MFRSSCRCPSATPNGPTGRGEVGEAAIRERDSQISLFGFFGGDARVDPTFPSLPVLPCRCGITMHCCRPRPDRQGGRCGHALGRRALPDGRDFALRTTGQRNTPAWLPTVVG